MKNIYIAIGFGIITASQFGLGTYMIILAGEEGGKGRFLHQGSFSLRVPVQPSHFHGYLSTHITCVCSSVTETWSWRVQVSPSFSVRMSRQRKQTC